MFIYFLANGRIIEVGELIKNYYIRTIFISFFYSPGRDWGEIRKPARSSMSNEQLHLTPDVTKHSYIILLLW